jgi:hypothetical protein
MLRKAVIEEMRAKLEEMGVEPDEVVVSYRSALD